jgi:hypothetical protein
MATHKFAAGQNVRFSPYRYEDASARGVYTIMRLLPEQGTTPQYRIKAKIDTGARTATDRCTQSRTTTYAGSDTCTYPGTDRSTNICSHIGTGVIWQSFIEH